MSLMSFARKKEQMQKDNERSETVSSGRYRRQYVLEGAYDDHQGAIETKKEAKGTKQGKGAPGGEQN